MAALFLGATIVAGGVVCTVAGLELLNAPIRIEWLVLLALTAGAGWLTLRVPSMPISFSISDTFTIMSALLVGPAAGALTAALDGLVLSFHLTKPYRSAPRVLFNVACLSTATWLAGHAYFELLGGEQPMREGAFGALRLLGAMFVFGGLHFAVNSGMVAAAVALERRESVVSIWRNHFSSLWVSSFGGTFAAMLMIVLARETAVEALILIAPLPVILYVALRHALGRAGDQIEHLGKLNGVYLATIEALAQAVDAKDQITHDHVMRVQDKSLEVAAHLGVRDDAQLQAIKAAGVLHDVGKIGIPEHILNKPGRLTAAEFEIMKRHPVIGADILSVIDFPYPLIPIVRHHHENWDGTGYPDGLVGEQIPIGARILQVVDCFDALTSDRPYRPAMSVPEAMAIVTERSGKMYDPRVVAALCELQLRAVEQQPVAVHATTPARPGATPIRKTPAPHSPEDSSTLLDTAVQLGCVVAMHRQPALIGDAIWNVLRGKLPASAFVLFMCDDAALVPVYRTGERTVAPTARIAVGERLSGWVAATRRSIVNSDARLDFDPDVRDVTPLRGALAVPVMRGDEMFGVMAFYAEAADAFGETHQHLARAAAAAAANVFARADRIPTAVAI